MSTSTYLLLDRGNTRIKWCLRTVSDIQSHGVTDLAGLSSLASGVERVLVSSVASEESDRALRESLGMEAWFAVSRGQSGELRNSYEFPERMGVDRWLAMLGAWTRSPERLCVIDAGSALTIDLVSASGVHEGGYILPGKALMQRSLLADTDRVRFDSADSFDAAPGTSTAEAVSHGSALSLAGAVRFALDRAARNGPVPRIYLTGGDASLLKPLLPEATQHCEHLVLEGLWRQACLEGVVSFLQIGNSGS